MGKIKHHPFPISFSFFCPKILLSNSWIGTVRRLIIALLLAVVMPPPFLLAESAGLRLATFDVDATPPIGGRMAYDAVRRHDELTLRCRGIVLIGAGRPIVLCAVDWIGIGNEGHDAFRAALAQAAGTDATRVAVHALHQHDAPACDFGAENLLIEAGIKNRGRYQDGVFQRDVIRRAAESIKTGLAAAQPVTHAGWGEAEVKHVASNRRIPGPDGRVRAVRFTATTDPKLRAEPEGVIDPKVSLLSFWNGATPLAVLSYYATHPQSYYRTGVPSSDFPGIARFIRGQSVPEALHVHFTGAGGNIGAGKYNDGSKENRMVLAQRLADGMKRAWEATYKTAISPSDMTWAVASVQLPMARYLDEAALRANLRRFDPSGYTDSTPDRLAWVLRCKRGNAIDLACLAVGRIRVLHMPGELFVEYQLAAKAMRPDLHVTMAAYGDYGPWYIGTQVAYGQGGYETQPGSSNVAPEVEKVLTEGMRKMLQAK